MPSSTQARGAMQASHRRRLPPPKARSRASMTRVLYQSSDAV